MPVFFCTLPTSRTRSTSGKTMLFNRYLRLWASLPPHACTCGTRPALKGDGLEALRRRIDEALQEDPMVETEVELSSSDGEGLALLYRMGKVLSTRFEDQRVLVKARIAASLRDRFQPRAFAGRETSAGA